MDVKQVTASVLGVEMVGDDTIIRLELVGDGTFEQHHRRMNLALTQQQADLMIVYLAAARQGRH